MKSDLHTHTKYSHDGTASVTEMCQAAINAGLDVLALTDHCDFGIGGENMNQEEYLSGEEKRKADIFQAKEQFKDKLNVLFGIEIGQPHHYPDMALPFLEARRDDFDVIIGSLHNLPLERDIYRLDYTSSSYAYSVLEEYFSDMINLVKMDCFDILAHLDYPLRVMGNVLTDTSLKKYDYLIEPILKLLAQNGKALEINTRGLFDWQKRLGPEMWVLKLFKDLGGEFITIGSDGHSTQSVGAGVLPAISAAADAGFKFITHFEKRKPVKSMID